VSKSNNVFQQKTTSFAFKFTADNTLEQTQALVRIMRGYLVATLVDLGMTIRFSQDKSTLN
jgi:hypothetical protein